MDEAKDDIADGSAETYIEGLVDGSKDSRDEAKMDWASVGWPPIDLGLCEDFGWKISTGFGPVWIEQGLIWACVRVWACMIVEYFNVIWACVRADLDNF